MSINEYKKKRDFSKTKEPKSKKKVKKDKNKTHLFVVQKHFSKHLHYDFRLEIDGVLKSWAIPKGPSTSSKDKRLAILVEDHPLEYASFEGTIPKGEYGAGKVEIWDSGHFVNLLDISMKDSISQGKLEFELFGKKLKGKYTLIHFKEKNWLLIKMKS